MKPLRLLGGNCLTIPQDGSFCNGFRQILPKKQRDRQGYRHWLLPRTPLHPHGLKAQRLYGLPNIRFHDLRHTAATLLLKQGVNVKVVSEMLGHADVSITLRIYAHVLPDMQQEAADKMDDAFG